MSVEEIKSHSNQHPNDALLKVDEILAEFLSKKINDNETHKKTKKRKHSKHKRKKSKNDKSRKKKKAKKSEKSEKHDSAHDSSSEDEPEKAKDCNSEGDSSSKSMKHLTNKSDTLKTETVGISNESDDELLKIKLEKLRNQFNTNSGKVASLADKVNTKVNDQVCKVDQKRTNSELECSNEPLVDQKINLSTVQSDNIHENSTYNLLQGEKLAENRMEFMSTTKDATSDVSRGTIENKLLLTQKGSESVAECQKVSITTSSTDGEILSSECEAVPSTKTHHKSRKHRKSSSHKSKSHHKKSSKRYRSRHRSRSSSYDNHRHGRSDKAHHRSHSKDHEKYEKRNRRSHSSDVGYQQGKSASKRHRRRRSSESISASRTPSPKRRRYKENVRRGGDKSSDLREKIDKNRLLEIARKNVMNMMQKGQLPAGVSGDKLEKEQLLAITSGGQSVEQLTDFCKSLARRDKNYSSSDSDENDDNNSVNSAEEDGPFINHPFKVSETKPNIVMKIRNAVQVPIKTPAEKATEQAKLRLQFPVSSGSQHRVKESEWVPVEKDKKTEPQKSGTVTNLTEHVPSASIQATKTQEAKNVVADKSSEQMQKALDLGTIVSERLSAVRKLQENPNDSIALTLMYRAQQKMQSWVQSKQLPGQFTGSTGAQVLSPEQLSGPNQAWVRKAISA